MTVSCRDDNTASLQADVQPSDHKSDHRAVQPADYNAVQPADHNAVHRAVQPADYNAVQPADHNAVDRAVQPADYNAVQPADHNAVHRAVQPADHNAVHSTVQPADHNAVHSTVQPADHNAVHRAVQSTDHTAVHHTDQDTVRNAVQGDAIVVNPVLWGQIAETLCEYGGGSSSDDSMDEPPQRSDDSMGEPLPNSDDSMDELSQSSDEPSTSTAQPRTKRANDMQATCHVCGRTFTSYKRLMGHHQANHLVMALLCDECGRKFSSSKLLAHHQLMCSIREEPPAKKPKRDSQVGRGHRAALQNNAAVETFIPTAVQDILGALRELEPTIITYLKEKLEDDDIKWYVNMHCVFKKPKKDAVTGAPTDDFDTEDVYQASKTYVAMNPEEIDNVIPEVFQTISAKFQEFQREGSGWTLDHVVKVEVYTATYDPLVGSSHILLPLDLIDSRSILNIKNYDNKCFLWCILAHLHPANDKKTEVRHYTKYEHELDVTGITFPMQLNQIKMFEKRNKMAINVFGYNHEAKKIVPLRLTTFEYETKINLLMISEETNNHYCLITNFNALMKRRTKHTGTQYYCFNCLHGFNRKENLQKHEDICRKNQTQ